MKKFLFILSLTIFFLMVAGLLFSSSENKLIANGVAAGILLGTFVWMPVFLFYAYDRRLRKKEALRDDQENEEDFNNETE